MGQTLVKMKRAFAALAFSVLALAAFAQGDTHINILKKDSLYRFETVTVNEYEDFTDTIVNDRFPARYLGPSEVGSYLINIIRQIEKKRENLQARVDALTADINSTVALYDKIHGDSAYFNFMIKEIADGLEGSTWRLTVRNGSTSKTVYSFNAGRLKGPDGKNAGRYTVTGRHILEVKLAGVPKYELKTRDNGQSYRANKNGVKYILKRI